MCLLLFLDVLILWLFFRINENHFLDIKMTVVRPCNHGGAVVAGILSNQHGGTGHGTVPPFDFSANYIISRGEVNGSATHLKPAP